MTDLDRLVELEKAMREHWFSEILPSLDYEIKPPDGSPVSWDKPYWAWRDHPWYALLELTEDECQEALTEPKELRGAMFFIATNYAKGEGRYAADPEAPDG